MGAVVRSVAPVVDRVLSPVWDVRRGIARLGRGDHGGPRRVLNVGCGRATELLDQAARQPDVTFVGVDPDELAVRGAAALAARRRLVNVAFHAVDPFVDEIPAPRGGWDWVVADYVHEQPGSATALARIGSWTALHGGVVLRLPASRFRDPLTRLSRALEHLTPSEGERLRLGRLLSQGLRAAPFLSAGWPGSTQRELAELVGRSGLQRIGWVDAPAWDPGSYLPAGRLLDRVRALPALRRDALIEELVWPVTLEVLLARRETRVPPVP